MKRFHETDGKILTSAIEKLFSIDEALSISA
jgi:hypothetical protein